jgi:hypothetical protein
VEYLMTVLAQTTHDLRFHPFIAEKCQAAASGSGDG